MDLWRDRLRNDLVPNLTPHLSTLELALSIPVLILAALALGAYMADLYQNRPTLLSPLVGRVETLLFKAAGLASHSSMTWSTYALAALLLSCMGFSFLYLILIYQDCLPQNPAHLAGLSPSLAFRVAVSSITHTRFSTAYLNDSLSPFSRYIGLTVQGFLATATGISVFIAMCRGLSGKTSGFVGNFWVDVIRTLSYVLIPLSLILVGLLAATGVSERVTELAANPAYVSSQPFPDARAESLALMTTQMGDMVSMAALPLQGTYFGRLISPFAMLVPLALCFAFGRIVDDRTQLSFLPFTLGLGLLIWIAADSPSRAHMPDVLSSDSGLLPGALGLYVLTQSIFCWLRGKRPQYLGRRLRPFDILMLALAGLILSLLVLTIGRFAAPDLRGGGENSALICLLTGLFLFVGRFWMMIPALAMAGTFSARSSIQSGA